jgi:UDP-N-acetylmuramate--alanine ligase
MFRKVQHIHFIGIGGIGMSGIAEVLLNLGYIVSGSDLVASDITQRLARMGARIFLGHHAENVRGAEVVVFSSAVTPDNVETIAARQHKIPVIPRAEMLAELMRMKYGVAIAGSHGKTTTTSLVATVLAKGELDPTMVIGGRLKSLGGNAKLGQGEFLVAEADESDGSFLRLTPLVAVVTNIDREHLDYYGDLIKIQHAFAQFINHIPFYGFAVLCGDDPGVRELFPQLEKRYLTYGVESGMDYHGDEIVCEGFHTTFTAYNRQRRLGKITLQIPGWHNVRNALAALAVGCELDIEFPVIQEALAEFRGVDRRLEVKGETQGIVIVDDYGHHPTEIRATLEAARLVWPGRRLLVVFQPHRYTRTQILWEEFCWALRNVDLLFLTEIYAAGEPPIPGVHAGLLYEGIHKWHPERVHFFPSKDKIVDALVATATPGDVILTLGAGDIWKVGEALLQRLTV